MTSDCNDSLVGTKGDRAGARRAIVCDDGTVRRFLLTITTAFLVAVGPTPVDAAAPGTEPPITIAAGRSITECISANPKPGCTTQREADGHQLAVLGVMGGGLAFVGWRVTRGIRRRDRAVNPA